MCGVSSTSDVVSCSKYDGPEKRGQLGTGARREGITLSESGMENGLVSMYYVPTVADRVPAQSLAVEIDRSTSSPTGLLIKAGRCLRTKTEISVAVAVLVRSRPQISHGHSRSTGPRTKAVVQPTRVSYSLTDSMHIGIRNSLERLQLPKPSSPLFHTLAAIGVIYTTNVLAKLASFAYLHFLRRSRLSRYAKAPGGSSAWAIVTGSSDGLGLGFANELLDNGFNVILHGRNPTKLESIRSSLLSQHPEQRIEILVLDAQNDVADHTRFSAVTSRFANHHITMLINNVGGPGSASPLCSPHADRTPGHDRIALDINVCFALEMTRVVLPLITRHGQPACVLNVGSGAARLPTPYIAVAGATKAFMEAWSQSLATEMVAEGHTQVDVRYELVGMCSTGSEKRPVSWMVPDARGYARKSLGLVGAGRRVVWGYWPHALQFEGLFRLPLWVKGMATTKIVKEQIMVEDRERIEGKK